MDGAKAMYAVNDGPSSDIDGHVVECVEAVCVDAIGYASSLFGIILEQQSIAVLYLRSIMA
jgi:hypothetical protein